VSDHADEMRAALAKMHEGMESWLPEPAPEHPADQPRITIHKIAHTMNIATATLYREGVISREEAEALGYEPPRPPSCWTRWKWARQSWWYDHKPHMHLGPCDHGDCE
jgi:hypothetical protein